MTQAGPAIPVVVSSQPPDGGPALRVAVVADGRPTEAGPARLVVVVTDGRPTQGNEPVPVVASSGNGFTLAGPPIPVVVVSGSLGGAAPVNTVLPAISGSTNIGDTLTATDGTWSNSPTSYAYQWKRGGVDIGGATANTYVLTSSDLNTTITVTVTATNASGSASATSAGTAIANWLLLDQFTTNAAAPLATPRTCEPGPGTLTIVDTNNIMSIASNALVVNGTCAINDRVVTPAAYARTIGRAFVFDIPTRTAIVSAALRPGLSATAAGSDLDIGYDVTTTTVVRIKYGTSIIDSPVTLGAGLWETACVLRSSGGFLLTRVGGGGGDYTLQWIYDNPNTTQFAKLLLASASAMNFTADNMRVIDLGGNFATDYGIATDRKAVTVAGDTIVMTANAFVEHTLTAATGITQDIMVRRTDDNNTWIIRCDQGGSTIAIIEKNAGVETSRGSAAQTWTNGTAYRVVAQCDGTSIRTYVQQGTGAPSNKANYGSAAFNQAATGVKVDRAGTNLISWPRAVTLPSL